MRIRVQFATCVILACAVSCVGQIPEDIHNPVHKAWDLLMNAAFSKSVTQRTDGIRALGLLRDDRLGRELAESALNDTSPNVRVAAATALGQMHATESVPKLQHAVDDRKIPVVMAAAHALQLLNDQSSAYIVYYELLTGERKADDGLIAQQMETLRNPRELAKIGFSEGIGYVPFAGMGWDAWRTIHKKDPNPARAVAATYLANDPDPHTAKALVKATSDKNWIVRAAAIEAIAKRGDASLLPNVEVKFTDKSQTVRYNAAAAVIRLSAIEESATAKGD